LYIKKITPNDISLVTTRYNWTSGIPYAKWDHTKNMQNSVFYVLTDENNVYKCLDNFGGANSTIKPTGNSFYPIRTSDGYLWKYMYTVPAFKRSRFSSLTNLPVQTALTDSFYNKGSIDAVVIENSGTGYVDAQLTSISVSGPTTGSGAIGALVVDGIGRVTNVTFSNGGTNYTKGANIIINTTTGTGAVITPIIVGGVITGVTVVTDGIGYSVSDNVSITVGGATVLPVISRVTG
jgi:hypothetical protein